MLQCETSSESLDERWETRCCNASKQRNLIRESYKCLGEHKSQMITSPLPLLSTSLSTIWTEVFLSIEDKNISPNWKILFLQIGKYICPNCKMYLYELTNVFVHIVKCICNEACHLVCSTVPFGKSTFHNTHSAWVIFFPDLPDNQSYLRGSSGGQKVVCQQRTFKTWTTNSILNWPQKQRLGFHPSLTCTWCVCLYSDSFENYCHRIVIKRWLASKEGFKYA